MAEIGKDWQSLRADNVVCEAVYKEGKQINALWIHAKPPTLFHIDLVTAN